MNQYDFAPIPPEDERAMRRYASIGFLFVVIVFLAIMLSSCKEDRYQPEISGAWTSVQYPQNNYLFHGNGTCEIYTQAFGSTIWRKWFAYEHNQVNGGFEMRNQDSVFFKGSLQFNQQGDTVRLQRDGALSITLSKW